jgi:predicted TIM-barrel fold metal-dependent hydrolase
VWLAADPRLLGSIVVSAADAELAAAEVRRAAADPRMVQVLVAYPRRLLGHRALDPLFAAAAELSLPLALQAGGGLAANNRGVTAVGAPASPFEYDVGWIAGAQHHLISLVCEGVFDRHPALRVVLSGFGIAWLPSLVWRLDDEFRRGALPRPPRLSRLPSEVVQEHVRLTTCGLELPERPDDLATLLSLVDGDRVVLYGSGARRGEVEPGAAIVAALTGDARRRVLVENALALYRGLG